MAITTETQHPRLPASPEQTLDMFSSLLSVVTSALLATTAVAWPKVPSAPFVQNVAVFSPRPTGQTKLAAMPAPSSSTRTAKREILSSSPLPPTNHQTVSTSSSTRAQTMVPLGRSSPRHTSMAMLVCLAASFFSLSCMSLLSRLASINLVRYCCLQTISLETFLAPIFSCMLVRTRGEYFMSHKSFRSDICVVLLGSMSPP